MGIEEALELNIGRRPDGGRELDLERRSLGEMRFGATTGIPGLRFENREAHGVLVGGLRLVEHVLNGGEIHGSISQDLFGRIKGAPGFTALTPGEQQRFLAVLNVVLRQPGARHHQAHIEDEFLRLLDRQVKNEYVLKRSDMDVPARTTLDHLFLLASADEGLMPLSLRGKKEQVLTALIEELASPEVQNNQGVSNDCTSCVANGKIARDMPEEYARVIAELASKGRARLFEQDSRTGQIGLSDEMALRFDPWSLSDKAMEKRSITESMYQTAAANLVGATQLANSRYDGLYQNQVETLYEALFGRAFVRLDARSPEARDQVIAELRRACRTDGANMVSLQWEVKGNHVNHALEVLRIEGDRVVIRNPWGREFDNPASVRTEVLDRSRSIYSMSISDFQRRLNYAVVSDADPQAKLGLTPGGDDPAVMVPTVFFVDTAAALATMQRLEEEQQRQRSQRAQEGERSHRAEQEGRRRRKQQS